VILIFDTKQSLLVRFIIPNYKFSVAQKMCRYTLDAKSFNILEIVLPRPRTASATIFSLGTLTNDFATLIYKYIGNYFFATGRYFLCNKYLALFVLQESSAE
jgi:hypothetical protein